MLTAKAGSETMLFIEFSIKDFHTLQFRKYISYDDHVFFSKRLKFGVHSRNGTKNSDKVFRFEIIAIELGVANSRTLELDTSHRQSMC